MESNYKGKSSVYCLKLKEITERESNTDSGSKIGVYCKNTTFLYLALTVRNLSKL